MTITDRRTFVRSLAGAAAASAVAGCSGSSDAGDVDSTTTDSGPFGVTDLVFVAEKPTGYDEYEEQPDATYEPGEVVWLYYNLENVGTESTGEGEARMHLSQSVTVTGPSGETLMEDTNEVEQEVPEASAAEGLYFYNNVTLPGDVAGGEYELAFEMTDEIGGGTVSESATFVVDAPPKQVSADGQFGVSNGAFCREEPTGYRQYVEQPDATYLTGRTVWYYFEIDGVTASRTDTGSYETSLSQAFTVTGPDGTTVLDEDYESGVEVDEQSSLEEYYFTNYVQLPSDATPGTYEVAFELTDDVTGESVSHAATFTVESSVVQNETAFEVDEFVFTPTETTSYGAYETQPDATFEAGDAIWFYLDVVGASYGRVPDGRLMRLEGTLTLTGPNGSVLYEDTSRYEKTYPGDTDPVEFFLTDGLTTQTGVPAGTYTVEFELRDLFSDDTTSVSAEFDIAN